ncbi:ATP12 family chaperone protein [Novosphingobium mathurense]|uniref:Chaperone required for the assembly of the F1-ATPase n=1 Tax=Novosphingobium mathurense TaxID=428990 RepID=A0A1U6GSW5_9SPHN|nr:ATP12 family protein [Novosphingobium mathurense]SLJ86631.1 Chaperone required for the assembly of the F1-ATPase [Novosphingobium mathurense]
MKRFYKEVTVGEADAGWRVLLDGRPIKTAGGRVQVVTTKPLAEALAEEWAAQGENIDPAGFVLRDLCDFAIDAIAVDRAEAIRDLVPYAETDTLCYRADPEDALFKRQQDVWEPLLKRAEDRWGLTFTRVSGIIHKPQPAQTLARLEQVLHEQDDFTLAGLRMLTSLAASLVVGLFATEPDADSEALWRAANLEEDWQIELWGEDWEAAERRKTRLEAFELAMRLTRLARES